MSDIVERLRFRSRYASETEAEAATRRYKDAIEAADEIERLTRELAEARNDLDLERQEGWNSAIEEAAKVAETYDPETADPDVYTEQAIAAAIRALVKP